MFAKICDQKEDDLSCMGMFVRCMRLSQVAQLLQVCDMLA